MLSINTYLETQALGVFSLGYGRLGPTEARLGLIALNTAPALGLGLSDLPGLGSRALDAFALAPGADARRPRACGRRATCARWRCGSRPYAAP